MFDAVIDAAQPVHLVPSLLPQPPRGRLVMIGAGSNSAAVPGTKLGLFV